MICVSIVTHAYLTFLTLFACRITGPMIGDFIIIKLYADRFDEAW